MLWCHEGYAPSNPVLRVRDMGVNKKDERRKREADAQMAKELDADMVNDSLARSAAKLNSKPIIDNGAEELFEKRLTKEEKKELAAQKKAEREAKKAAAAAAAAGEAGDAPSTAPTTKAAAAKAAKPKGETKAERVQREQRELDDELEAARVEAVRRRNLEGAHLGHIEAPTFSLPNPGGGPDLIERASYTLQRGRSYGLCAAARAANPLEPARRVPKPPLASQSVASCLRPGCHSSPTTGPLRAHTQPRTRAQTLSLARARSVGRNGCGKSTLLKAMASRRVGCIPPNVTVHYVSQEVSLTEITLAMTPVDVVVNADVERRLLLAERDALIAAEAAGEEIDGERLQGEGGVLEQLQLLDVDTVEARATALLTNLGFSEELRARPMSALSGGWRVRTMLAAAIFGKPDMLLLDEPTNHLSIAAVLWLARELKTSPTWEVQPHADAPPVEPLSMAVRHLSQPRPCPCPSQPCSRPRPCPACS